MKAAKVGINGTYLTRDAIHPLTNLTQVTIGFVVDETPTLTVGRFAVECVLSS